MGATWSAYAAPVARETGRVTTAPEHLIELVERSADRERVRVSLDQLRVERPDELEPVLDDLEQARTLVALLAASRSLTRLLRGDPLALPSLADVDRRMAAPEGSMDEVVAWERREILRIAARDLTGRDGVEATTGLLADGARDVLVAAEGPAGADPGVRDQQVVGGGGDTGG